MAHAVFFAPQEENAELVGARSQRTNAGVGRWWERAIAHSGVRLPLPYGNNSEGGCVDGGLSKRLEAPGQASACVVKKDEVEKPSGGLVLAVTPAH